MKVFIWERVLQDHTYGMAVAYAETLEQAIGLFEDHIANELSHTKPTKVIDCDSKEPPFGAYVFGGG